MSAVQVVKGQRYAFGLSVPLLASLTGPLAGLKEATEETGFHALATDGEAGLYLASMGWSNAIVYRAGRAGISEPPGDHDYVLLATRTGDTSTVNPDDPAFAGSVRWILPVATVAPPGGVVPPTPGGVPVSPPPSSGESKSWTEQPLAVLGIFALLVAVAATAYALSDD